MRAEARRMFVNNSDPESVRDCINSTFGTNFEVNQMRSLRSGFGLGPRQLGKRHKRSIYTNNMRAEARRLFSDGRGPDEVKSHLNSMFSTSFTTNQMTGLRSHLNLGPRQTAGKHNRQSKPTQARYTMLISGDGLEITHSLTLSQISEILKMVG